VVTINPQVKQLIRKYLVDLFGNLLVGGAYFLVFWITLRLILQQEKSQRSQSALLVVSVFPILAAVYLIHVVLHEAHIPNSSLEKLQVYIKKQLILFWCFLQFLL